MNRTAREARDERIRLMPRKGSTIAWLAHTYMLTHRHIEDIVTGDNARARAYAANDLANPAHYRDPEKGEAIDAMPAHFRRWLRANMGRMDRVWNAGTVDAGVVLMMLGFVLGNSSKYRWRRGRKDDVGKDDAKISWYDAFAEHLVDPEHHADPRDSR